VSLASWARLVSETRLETGRYVVASVGDRAALADERLALVPTGPKRATESLASDLQPADSDPFRAVGDEAFGSRARAVHVEVKPLWQVDDSFTWDEGEGDRTRAWWLVPQRRSADNDRPGRSR